MKCNLLFIGLLLSGLSFGQRVGVNKSNPTEALDVNGNINLSGTVKANGVAGTAGQVLMSTGEGLGWANTSEQYKNFRQYFTTGETLATFSFTVPAGVIQVFIEIWGAGGGGNTGGGGAAGSYRAVLAPVTPGSSFTINTGAAGKGVLVGSLTGGNRSATNGQGSSVVVGANVFLASGGNAATNSAPGIASEMAYQNPPANFSTLTMAGTSGEEGAITNLFFPTSSVTDYNSLYNGGNGGAAYQFAGQQGKGGEYYRYTSGIPTNTVLKVATSAVGFGCGGGGMLSATLPGTQRAAGNGSPGMVIVRW